MSLRDLESYDRNSSLKHLADIQDGMTNSNGLTQPAYCLYCHKKIIEDKPHRCYGKRLADVYGEDRALSIMKAQRGASWSRNLHRIRNAKPRRSKYAWSD